MDVSCTVGDSVFGDGYIVTSFHKVETEIIVISSDGEIVDEAAVLTISSSNETEDGVVVISSSDEADAGDTRTISIWSQDDMVTRRDDRDEVAWEMEFTEQKLNDIMNVLDSYCYDADDEYGNNNCY